MKLIYIEWNDAFCNTGWLSKAELKKLSDEEEFIIKEVGWVFKESKKQIVLVSRYKPEDVRHGEEFGLVQKIPKTWIRKRIDLTKHIKK